MNASAPRRDFDSLWNYSDPAGTESRFEALVPAARTSGDAAYLAELLTQIARAQGLQQRFDVAHQTLDQAQALLPVAGDRARVRYLLERGRVFNSSKRPDEARPLFLQAWELASDTSLDDYAVDAAHMMAIVEPPDRQLEWLDRAMQRAEASDDPRARNWLGSLYNNAGWTYHDLGRYEDALATFQKGLEWQKAAGKEEGARTASWTVGRALRSLGRYEDALQVQQDNFQACQKAGTSDGYVAEEIAECLLALGRADDATAYFARAFTMLAGDPWLQRDEPERLHRLAELGHVDR